MLQYAFRLYVASSDHFRISVPVLPRRKGTRKTRKKRRSQNPKARSQKTKRMVLGFCCGGFDFLGHGFWQRLKRVSSSCEQICSGNVGTEFRFP